MVVCCSIRAHFSDILLLVKPLWSQLLGCERSCSGWYRGWRHQGTGVAARSYCGHRSRWIASNGEGSVKSRVFRFGLQEYRTWHVHVAAVKSMFSIWISFNARLWNGTPLSHFVEDRTFDLQSVCIGRTCESGLMLPIHLYIFKSTSFYFMITSSTLCIIKKVRDAQDVCFKIWFRLECVVLRETIYVDIIRLGFWDLSRNKSDMACPRSRCEINVFHLKFIRCQAVEPWHRGMFRCQNDGKKYVRDVCSWSCSGDKSRVETLVETCYSASA